ncbi:hypothetical protein AURDEDRAFT_178510 [Auricularia subglabra TFB-10046 SS5]|uniref:F-box domain-containing protein n=1 Tax=Auricularia subglabra (strain TFB-10046 / SS5) TaxID=717982 RepID=J0L7Y7_AURST|nr:hypothetical protein AURDEDRAFT_178510 [Auricularia subglabra TFB-10046 SS5]
MTVARLPLELCVDIVGHWAANGARPNEIVSMMAHSRALFSSLQIALHRRVRLRTPDQLASFSASAERGAGAGRALVVGLLIVKEPEGAETLRAENDLWLRRILASLGSLGGLHVSAAYATTAARHAKTTMLHVEVTEVRDITLFRTHPNPHIVHFVLDTFPGYPVNLETMQHNFPELSAVTLVVPFLRDDVLSDCLNDRLGRFLDASCDHLPRLASVEIRVVCPFDLDLRTLEDAGMDNIHAVVQSFAPPRVLSVSVVPVKRFRDEWIDVYSTFKRKRTPTRA